MGRLRMLTPRLETLAPRVQTMAQAVPTYGHGRGGRPWRRKREAVLKRDQYLCQPCQRAGRITEATEVDHMLNLAEGGTDDDTNLQSICTDCHQAKTQAEAQRGVKGSW
ncbi:HNH endonuclease [Xanthomonas sp. NCPPB 3005]|uniref:HNH endonuclease n=1 Tax=Xanthomonas sp. NCPPB 3005 TaxID=3240913 RepID=UPI0035125BCA